MEGFWDSTVKKSGVWRLNLVYAGVDTVHWIDMHKWLIMMATDDWRVRPFPSYMRTYL